MANVYRPDIDEHGARDGFRWRGESVGRKAGDRSELAFGDGRSEGADGAEVAIRRGPAGQLAGQVLANDIGGRAGSGGGAQRAGLFDTAQDDSQGDSDVDDSSDDSDDGGYTDTA